MIEFVLLSWTRDYPLAFGLTKNQNKWLTKEGSNEMAKKDYKIIRSWVSPPQEEQRHVYSYGVTLQ